jgi:glycosyltransferase involved in cell wall biosynthesis
MRVLFVTKALSPPWNDAGKLVPRDLALGMAGALEVDVMVAHGDTTPWPRGIRAHPVHPSADGYRTGPLAQLAVMAATWRLSGAADVLHFFFQPHRRASQASRWLTRACRRPAVHTVLSAPADRPSAGALLFANRTVALSRDTARALTAGSGAAVEVVPPGLAETASVGDARARAMLAETGLTPGFVLYPGDYEAGGHRLLIEAWSAAPDLPPLVLAGRAKTPGAAPIRARIAADVTVRGLDARVRVLGTVSDMPGLIASARAVVFPAATLHAKTDVPLVLLEAWRESVPVLVRDLPPLVELVEGVSPALPAEPAAWIDAMRGLRSSAAEWGRAGRARFEERHRAAIGAARYAGIYRELVDARAGDSRVP